MTTAKNRKKKEKTKNNVITSISVKGFKSIAEECRVDIRPLTILAGANSSGKTSILQPMLLIKQTLDASYDPGVLLLDGPHVKFTTARQIMSKIQGKAQSSSFSFSVEVDSSFSIKNTYKKLPGPKRGVDLSQMILDTKDFSAPMKLGMEHNEILNIVPEEIEDIRLKSSKELEEIFKWQVKRGRGFFRLVLVSNKGIQVFPFSFGPSMGVERDIQRIIHVPGFRGNPERTYRTTAIGTEFPGTFDNYVASVINHWQINKDPRRKKLNRVLETLGLTWRVYAKPVDDTQVKIRVGRLPSPVQGGMDMVSIADAGFGLSQILPVIVALIMAESGQLVYLEQPELHLHPRAQVSLARVIADAAKQGVRVIAETHSGLLLLAIQALVAEGYLDSENTILHWFNRRGVDGVTEVVSSELDEFGAYGDWPEDFGEIDLEVQKSYLDASAKKRLKLNNGRKKS